MEVKMKENSVISRLFAYAKKFKYLTIASWILSVISAWCALIPFYFIWRLMKEALRVEPNFADAQNMAFYGWMAVNIFI